MDIKIIDPSFAKNYVLLFNFYTEIFRKNVEIFNGLNYAFKLTIERILIRFLCRFTRIKNTINK